MVYGNLSAMKARSTRRKDPRADKNSGSGMALSQMVGGCRSFSLEMASRRYSATPMPWSIIIKNSVQTLAACSYRMIHQVLVRKISPPTTKADDCDVLENSYRRVST